MVACCCWRSWTLFATICWRDTFVCIVCLLSVAMFCAVRFALCKLIVLAIMSAVFSSESSFVAGPEKWLLWTYPLCIEVIVPDVRHCWYASWMKGQRLIHVWLPSGFCSQSSMSRCYRPHRAMRSRAFWRSCWVMYGFCARVAISWQLVHRQNRISGQVLWIVHSQEHEVALAHCVRGRFPHTWSQADQKYCGVTLWHSILWLAG
jgi:hypothetical protein